MMHLEYPYKVLGPTYLSNSYAIGKLKNRKVLLRPDRRLVKRVSYAYIHSRDSCYGCMGCYPDNKLRDSVIAKMTDDSLLGVVGFNCAFHFLDSCICPLWTNHKRFIVISGFLIGGGFVSKWSFYLGDFSMRVILNTFIDFKNHRLEKSLKNVVSEIPNNKKALCPVTIGKLARVWDRQDVSFMSFLQYRAMKKHLPRNLAEVIVDLHSDYDDLLDLMKPIEEIEYCNDLLLFIFSNEFHKIIENNESVLEIFIQVINREFLNDEGFLNKLSVFLQNFLERHCEVFLGIEDCGRIIIKVNEGVSLITAISGCLECDDRVSSIKLFYKEFS